ncbi:MAG: ATP-binding cassette domain-containing protein [Clostridia bacterium]|nr:ATP-binding cassette domain-containing protein [Clostridia bacterium]
MIFGKHLNRYYLRYSWILLLGVAALVAVDFYQLEIPELYNLLINGMNQGQVELNGVFYTFDLDFLLDHICLPLIFVILVLIVGRFLWRMCFLGAAVLLEEKLRNRMFDRCRLLSREYYQVNKVGNLMSLFTNDLETVQECFGWGVLMVCDAAFLGGLALVKMWRMNFLLTLLSLVPMAFLMAVGIIVGKSLMHKWDVRQEAFSSLSDFSQESFSGIAVIKAFVKEFKELMAFKALNVENERANVDHTRSATLLRIFVMLFVESVICIILGYGGYLVHSGVFNAGQLFEFIGYFNSIVWPVMAVSELIEMSSRGKASLKRISILLDAPIDVKDRDGVSDLENARGSVEFRNLTFRYPDGEFDALKDVSFTISAGENVGIVGKTGAGKTTLVDLILRAYNVPDGTLFVDGRDVNELSIQSVRAAAAYVPQDNFLFSDNIYNNIAFGVDDPSAQTVEDAAVLSDVHGNISEFKDGYETVLENGVLPYPAVRSSAFPLLAHF